MDSYFDVDAALSAVVGQVKDQASGDSGGSADDEDELIEADDEWEDLEEEEEKGGLADDEETRETKESEEA